MIHVTHAKHVNCTVDYFPSLAMSTKIKRRSLMKAFGHFVGADALRDATIIVWRTHLMFSRSS